MIAAWYCIFCVLSVLKDYADIIISYKICHNNIFNSFFFLREKVSMQFFWFTMSYYAFLFLLWRFENRKLKHGGSKSNALRKRTVPLNWNVSKKRLDFYVHLSYNTQNKSSLDRRWKAPFRERIFLTTTATTNRRKPHGNSGDKSTEKHRKCTKWRVTERTGR